MKFLTPLILIALAIGIFFTFTDSRYESALAVKAETQEYIDVLSKSRELEKVRDELLIEFNGFDPNAVTRLEKLLPDNVENVRLVMEIDNIAAQYGMTVRDVELSSDDSGDEIAETERLQREKVNISFTVSAPYADFVLFLKDLENSLRLVDIRSISVDTADIDFHDYTIGLDTYWLTKNNGTYE